MALMQQTETVVSDAKKKKSHESDCREETSRGTGNQRCRGVLSLPPWKDVRQTQATLFELSLAPRSQTWCLLLRTKTDDTKVPGGSSFILTVKNHTAGL